MPRFRKRPVIVEARQLTVENIEELEQWCNGSIKGIRLSKNEWVIDIQTLEGEMRADIDDWIIQGVKGEFYPCKDEVFRETYEAAEK